MNNIEILILQGFHPMDHGINPLTNLRVLNGGLQIPPSYGHLRIVSAPGNSPPFKVDAMAYEEDTYLIMSAKPENAPHEVHPLRLMAELENLTPETPGSVRVTGKNPLKFLAVIHDVDNVPTWREDWIDKALGSIFMEAEKRKIHALGLPILGTKHGNVKHARFARFLGRALRQTRFEFLCRLWLIAEVPENSRLMDMLKSELADV